MTEWAKKKYNEAYTEYMPWIEDKVLGYWGENKTSYTAKEKLNTDLTGDKNVQAIQSGLAEGVGGQLSSGGLLGGVGDVTSKEGVNRAERGDPGLDAKELERLDVAKKEKEKGEKGKGWTETLTMGYFGGGGK